MTHSGRFTVKQNKLTYLKFRTIHGKSVNQHLFPDGIVSIEIYGKLSARGAIHHERN